MKFNILISFIIQLCSIPSYYKLIEDISFNFKDKNEDTIHKLKNFYSLTQNSKIEKNIILLDTNQQDNIGILKLKKQINSSNFEIQINLKLSPQNKIDYGSIFYIWFFNKENNKGNGFIIYTYPSQKTYFYPIINNKTIYNLTFDELLLDNNKNIINNDYYCSTINFLEKYEKITIRIKDSKLSFYFNSSLNLFSQCLRDFEGDENSFRSPLYFSIGTINKNQFRSKVEITKIRFFDKEIKNKELIFNIETFNNRKKQKQKNIIKIFILFIISFIFIVFLYKISKKNLKEKKNL